MAIESGLPPDEIGDSPAVSGPSAPTKDNSTTWAGQGTLSRGEVIGAYLLISLIGEGGMGEVWLAEQKAPVRRRVAIKIIKPGMNTREVAARFAAERQTLALMNHPGIAQMFDTGLPAMDGPTSPWNMSPGLRLHTIATNTLSPRGRELGGLSVE